MEDGKLEINKIRKRKEEILDFKRKNKTDSALSLIRILIEDLMFYNDLAARSAIGWGMHQAGAIYEKTEVSWEEAKEWYQAAFAYRKAIDDFVGQAYTIFQIAMLEQAYKLEEENIPIYFQRAKPYVLQAVSMLESKHLMMAATAEDKEDLGSMYQNLAYIFQQEGDDQQAMLAYKKALDFRKKIGDRRGTGITLARMAEVEEDLQKAERYLNNAYRIFDSIGDINWLKQVRETREKIQKRRAKRKLKINLKQGIEKELLKK